MEQERRRLPGAGATPGSHRSGSAAPLRLAAHTRPTRGGECGPGANGVPPRPLGVAGGRGRRSRWLAPHLPHLPARPGTPASFASSGRQLRAGRGWPAKPRSEGRPGTSRGRLSGGGGHSSTGSRAAPSADPRVGRAPTAAAPGPAPPPRPGPALTENAAQGSLLPAGGRRGGGRGSWFRSPLRPLLTPTTLAYPVRLWPLHPQSSGGMLPPTP